MTILVLNGPNIGRLGTREPTVYGPMSYSDLVDACEALGVELDREVIVRQTDHEGEMIAWLHDAADEGLPVVLNAGAWTHTSIAVRDAATQLRAPFIEVHLSNVHAREAFRHRSYLSDIAEAVIAGMGVDGYLAAIRYLAK